jgi:tryptophan synthase alpha chain
MNVSPLTAKIRKAHDQGRLALIPFLPAGFPDRLRFWAEIEELDHSGADVIEIGMPFSDPVADGPTVERASLRSLELGVSLSWILEELAKRRPGYAAEFVLMGYLNPILQYGVERFAVDAARAGVAGVIVADLPYEEAAELRATLAGRGLALIPLVGLNTPRERLDLYAKTSQGFVYFVSVLGTTGERESLPDEVKDKLAATREAFEIPVALGFGLRSPEQLRTLRGLVDAAVFGSALIRHIEAGGRSGEFMRAWK